MHVNIWQIYFRPEQFAQLDPCFTPLDNSSQQDESREFQVFSRLQASSQANQFSHWGALSWKFNQKTGWFGQPLLDTVSQTPEVDVFYMNPYPHNEALHVSPWWQGEVAHPDFLMVSESFLMAAGLDESLCHRLTPGHEYSLCNYLVGSPLFWSKYLDFVRNALDRAGQQMPIDLRLKMHSADADWKGIHHQSTYVPFIVERLFGFFCAVKLEKA